MSYSKNNSINKHSGCGCGDTHECKSILDVASPIEGQTLKYSETFKAFINVMNEEVAQVNADWNSTSGLSEILNKPTIPNEYELPIASSTVLGGIKVGDNLTIGADGKLNASAGGSSIPMIAGTGVDSTTGISNSLVGNSPLTASRASKPFSMALGKGTTVSSDAAIAFGIDSEIGTGCTGTLAGGLWPTIGNGSAGCVVIGIGNNIGTSSQGSAVFGQNNDVGDSSSSSVIGGLSNEIKGGCYAATVFGQNNTVNSSYGFSVGLYNIVGLDITAAMATGYGTTATADYASAEGKFTKASGVASHAEGSGSGADSIVASGEGSHAEGSVSSKATGQGSHSEGWQSIASGDYSHCEGGSGTASGQASHVEGYANTASGIGSHAEGQNNSVTGDGSHAEGSRNTSTNTSNHAEGFDNIISGQGAHVEGHHNKATGTAAHCEGSFNEANNDSVHVEGMNNYANAPLTHVEGQGNIAGISHQHVQGKYALDDTGYVGTNPKIHKIGYGDDADNRKDIHFVRADGTIGTAAFKTNGTGTPTGLGAKCPAVTATTPYAWLQFELSDGSIVYMPAWK